MAVGSAEVGAGGRRGRLGVSLAVLLALALGCGGEPLTLPVDGCPPGRLPAGATGIPLAAHLRARPPWSTEDGALVHPSAGGPLPLPPLPEPQTWMASAAGSLPGGPDDGLLLCRVRATRPTTWLHARLSWGEVEVRARTGTFAPEGTLWLSLPALSAPAPRTLELEAADLSSRTELDPFFLLAAGAPIPRTRSSMAPLGRIALTTSGTRPWRGSAEATEAECAAFTREEVERALAPTWEAIEGGLAAMCRGSLELGWPRAQEDGLRVRIAEAAGAVGWADPRLRAAVEQIERVRQGFRQAGGTLP